MIYKLCLLLLDVEFSDFLMLVDILPCAKLWRTFTRVSSADELDIARGGCVVMLILTDLFRYTLRELGKPYTDLLSVLMSIA